MAANAISYKVTFAASLRRFGEITGGQSEVGWKQRTDHLWLKATALFLSAFLLYFLTRTPALDEFDSVNFAMGVTRGFNLWQDQPHAPGYPLFIFLGWLGRELFGLPPESSLHFISALGGGLLVASWFAIVRLQFDEKLAWWVALCLAITPAVWMAATKVLTDPLAAGLISLELWAAVRFQQSGRRTWVVLMSVGGAAAAGTRPQLILVALMIVGTALSLRRSSWNLWALTLVTFVVACLVWLLPMWYLQWRLRPELPAWLVYPELLYKQWQWRLDKPATYIGAGDWTLRYLASRAGYHFLGWFNFGFGFIRSPFTIGFGWIIALTGLASYYWRARQESDKKFWRLHRWWGLVHVATIFISLSAAQRYYLLIFPLLLVVLLRGFALLPFPWSRAAITLPALLLYIAIPLAIDNYREEPPSVRLVTFLKRLYPPKERPLVVLLLAKARRHAEWYAPDFMICRDLPVAEGLRPLLERASAVYTDDAGVQLPAGWRRVRVAVFSRSPLIYMKDHLLELYLVERGRQG